MQRSSRAGFDFSKRLESPWTVFGKWEEGPRRKVRNLAQEPTEHPVEADLKSAATAEMLTVGRKTD